MFLKSELGLNKLILTCSKKQNKIKQNTTQQKANKQKPQTHKQWRGRRIIPHHVAWTGGGGGCKFGFGWNMPCEFESRPIQIQIFHENVTHSYTNQPILGQILWEKIARFFQNFLIFWANFGSNFGKFWKIHPFIYQMLHFIRVHLYTKRLILLPMLAARPRWVFFTEYPPSELVQTHVRQPLKRNLKWHTHPDSFQPATWVSYDTLLLWLPWTKYRWGYYEGTLQLLNVQ